MKSRNLKTIYDLIAANYNKTQLPNGKFLHTFTPSTTNTVYEFEANSADEIVVGEHYNIGFNEVGGKKIVDLSCLSVATRHNKFLSYTFAIAMSENNHTSNKKKNDQRVTHSATSGYYWGKKYAWREFGLVLPQQVFYKYLALINHPAVACQTVEPSSPFKNNQPSIAYLETGIQTAIDNLIDSAVRVGNGTFYISHLYDSGNTKFTIKGINAITDKK